MGTAAPSHWKGLLPLTPVPTACPCRGVLLRRGGVLDHGGAVRRVDSAEQVRASGMGSVANTDGCPLLILPAHSPLRGLLQTQGQSLLPKDIGGEWGCGGISGQEPDQTVGSR